jgi:2'-5' RNA ligase
VRLFVAVNLPDAIRRDLFERLDPIRGVGTGVRWLEPNNFHITLKFLGSVQDTQIESIQDGLWAAAAQVPAFELTLSRFGAFPNFRRARVYWVGVEDDGWLGRLQSAVEQQIAPLGFPTEARPFHPHITVGRANQLTAAELGAVEASSAPFPFRETISVSSMELMESKLSPKGARYEPVFSALLAGTNK